MQYAFIKKFTGVQIIDYVAEYLTSQVSDREIGKEMRIYEQNLN